jgi:GcrA cell cycle regulator
MSASVWTAQLTHRLIALWKEGRTAAAVADLLGPGISRCAVLGKVHRLGLVREAPSGPPRRAGARAGEASASPGARASLGQGRPPASRRPESRAASLAPCRETPAAPGTPLTTILSVKRGQCRWPYGSPGRPGFGLCGRPVARGAFCVAHAAIGYRKRPASAEGLLRLAGLGPFPPGGCDDLSGRL